MSSLHKSADFLCGCCGCCLLSLRLHSLAVPCEGVSWPPHQIHIDEQDWNMSVWVGWVGPEACCRWVQLTASYRQQSAEYNLERHDARPAFASDPDGVLGCRESKAPFTFVVQLMVPGPPFLSLTMAWAADYDPSARPPSETPHSPEGHASFAGIDGDSDSELVKSPFDLCLARSARTCSTSGCKSCQLACCD